MVAAELPGAQAPLLNAVTALEDRLGLTPKAMRLMLWQVGVGDDIETGAAPAGAIDIRERLRAVAE